MGLKQVGLLDQEQRCPVILLLDRSASMAWATRTGKVPIEELNKGLAVFKKAVQEDEILAMRVDVAIVTFGPVELCQNFVTIDRFMPPQLQASDVSPMGEAIEFAIDLAEKQKAFYREQVIPYYQPLIFMITDGQPGYGYKEGGQEAALEKALLVSQRLKSLDNGRGSKPKLTFFSIGVQGANMSILKQITPAKRPGEIMDRVQKLNGLNFTELFQWIAQSVGQAARLGTQARFAPTSALSSNS